ncbi:hypothetical protein PRIPAC_97104 [Pristionchus pacificus]|uniref:Uncharacterized protein n=1 Tax=Pristionchus pacificus TaxID=54126 RepID=A0A454XRR5_PRIPA|nr:hypothetical protein PRIPAC_97104 [Pristionchus pacificus]|eukprot:PDM81717.1 hypothetical protein PRIPAC_30698 [Pristionchus pacificus]
MSLLPLTVFDCIRRACRYNLLDAYSPSDMEYQLAERILAHASLADLLRWRTVSVAFRKAATKRISSYSKMHIRVYDGLTELRAKSKCKSEWPCSANVLLCEMDTDSVGICIDSKLNWKDAKAMISLIAIFRHSAEQVYMDSPVVDLLLKHLNSSKVHSLLQLLTQKRRQSFSLPTPISYFLPLDDTHNELVLPNKTAVESGPFFPRLKKFTVTADKSQLTHLSRIISYCVAVESVFEKEDVDLVVLGESWCRSKQRLFRHVSSFKHWLDASSLGVKYVQQFQGKPKRHRTMSPAKC